MTDAVSSILGGLGTGASDLFSGNFGGALSSLGGGLTGALEDVGHDVGGLFSGTGGLGGLLGLNSGGGGPVSPGTVANNASSLVPSGASVGVPSVSGAAPAAPSSVAAFAQAPGVGAGDLNLSAPGGPTINPLTPQPDLAPALGLPTSGAGALVPPSGGSNFLKSLLNNPKALLSLGALGYDLTQSGNTSQEKALQALANQQAGISKNQQLLAQGEQQGILPQGAESLVEQTLQANEAAIRSKYAQLGMSGSTAEVQDLAAAREQAQALAFQIGSNLAQQGFANATQETGVQSTLLQSLLQSGLARDQQLAQVLAEFGGALSPAPQLVYATAPQTTGGP